MHHPGYQHVLISLHVKGTHYHMSSLLSSSKQYQDFVTDMIMSEISINFSRMNGVIA